jgi:hypothetical protein
MKFNFPINNFTSGEWSPKMSSRTDTEQYSRACENLTNMIVQMQGGAQYRGGTRYIEIQDAGINTAIQTASWVKLIPYVCALDKSKSTIFCMFKPAAGTVRIVTLPDCNEVTYVSTGIGPAFTSAAIDYVQIGDYLVLTDISGTVQPAVIHWYPAIADYAHWPYLDFTLALTADFWKVRPFDKINALDSNVTLTSSATAVGATTITSSANFFSAGMVGSYLKFQSGTSALGKVLITGYTNATTVTGTIFPALPILGPYGGSAAPTTAWQISAWNGAYGWPKHVASFQGRLIFGGSSTKPDTIWGSRIGNYFDFDEVPSQSTSYFTTFTTDNSRPFTLTPNSAEVSNIVAMSSSKTLVINTDRSEIVAYGANGALGPNNVVFESSTSFGGNPVQPQRVNNYLTFVQKTGRKIRDVIFNFNEDQYKSTDLSFLVDHFFFNELNDFAGKDSYSDPIAEMATTNGSSSVLWLKSTAGNLYCVTLDRDYQVNAWAKVLFGFSPEGAAFGSAPRAKVIAMCAADSDQAGGIGAFGESSLFMLTQRYSPTGTLVTCFEQMTPAWATDRNPWLTVADDLRSGAFCPTYLDFSARSIDTWATIIDETHCSFGSLYANTTVSVIVNGLYIGEQLTDAAGTVIWPDFYNTPTVQSHVQIGFKYPGIIKTMPIEQGGQTGMPVGRLKRVDEMVVRVFGSNGFKFGKDLAALEEVNFRDPAQPMDEPNAYYTGDKVVNFPPGYERKAQIIITQESPEPLYVTCVAPRGVTYD